MRPSHVCKLLATSWVAFASLFAGAATLNPLSLNLFTEAHRDKPEWRWTPKLQFTLYGPVESGSTLVIRHKVGGKPWFESDCAAGPLGNNEIERINDCGARTESHKSINQTGTFGFEIVLTNALSGTSTVLRSGQYNVGKFVYNPTRAADRSRQFYYTVDHDWRLPVAFVQRVERDYHAVLGVDLLFKQKIMDLSRLTAHLFFKDKEVATASASGTYASNLHETNPNEYHAYRFNFQALFAAEYPENFRMFKLYENPGDYTVKVLREGKLARTLSFTVGANGQLADNGIAAQNKLPPGLQIVPVALLGDGDGAWNREAWKTQALWFNPIKGFAAR